MLYWIGIVLFIVGVICWTIEMIKVWKSKWKSDLIRLYLFLLMLQIGNLLITIFKSK